MAAGRQAAAVLQNQVAVLTELQLQRLLILQGLWCC
jgi:hypothetical protein